MSGQGPVLEVIEPYLQEIKTSGRNNIMALCPLPDHDDREASFAINTENGLWMCHSCGRRGNLHQLLRIIGVSSKVAEGLLEPIKRKLKKHKTQERRRRLHRFMYRNMLQGEVVLPESLLGLYYWKPPGLVEAGFDPTLLRKLQIGYDPPKDRVTYPLRDTIGNLIGISGRTLKDEFPRYKVYSGGHRVDGHWRDGDFGPEFDEQYKNYSIKSHQHLWNGHRVFKNMVCREPGPLFVVEGFKACIWLIQHGWENTVALMGSSISATQVDLLCLMAHGPVVLFLDNDTAGLKGTMKIGGWLSKYLRVQVCSYYPSWAEEPDSLNMAGLTRAIEARERYTSWKTRLRKQLDSVRD